MNHPIRHLRDAQLDEQLQAQLAPIIDAYRPHDDPPLLSDLRRELLYTKQQERPLSFDAICKQAGVITGKKM